MWRPLSVFLLALCMTACASQRQPRVRCSGHLQRINAPMREAPPAKQEGPSPETGGEQQ